MNKKICSQCEETFDIDEANYRDYFSSPLCNKCYDKGLKPSGWPEHCAWTHSRPRKYDKNNCCMFCEENVPDGLYPLLVSAGYFQVSTTSLSSWCDHIPIVVYQLKGLC